MTGGRWRLTTLLGMKATTAAEGKKCGRNTAIRCMCEIMNQLTAPYYLERTTCDTPANVRKTKAAIKKAFQNQIDGKGFSMVEIVTTCPTNWGLDPIKALDFLHDNMLKEYPLGVIREINQRRNNHGKKFTCCRIRRTGRHDAGNSFGTGNLRINR